MKKTYLNIYKKYIPIILILLTLMMLSGLFTRKKIYNKDFDKLKKYVIVIDNDKTNLSNLIKDVLKTKNKIIEFDNELDATTYLQNGKAKAVYIIQNGLQNEFFTSSENNSKVIKKIVEHYGLSREKMAGISVGNMLEAFNFEMIDTSLYEAKYEKSEKGQNDFINDLRNQIIERNKKPENLNIEFIDFSKNKIMYKENILNILSILTLLGIIIYISSFVKVKILNKENQFRLKEKELYNKNINKKIIKSILPIDILFVNIYTIFSVMVAWLSNINGLKFADMLILLGIFYLLSIIIYNISIMFVLDKTEKKKAKK